LAEVVAILLWQQTNSCLTSHSRLGQSRRPPDLRSGSLVAQPGHLATFYSYRWFLAQHGRVGSTHSCGTGTQWTASKESSRDHLLLGADGGWMESASYSLCLGW